MTVRLPAAVLGFALTFFGFFALMQPNISTFAGPSYSSSADTSNLRCKIAKENGRTAKQLSTVGDRIWHDANKNGIQDEKEKGIEGIEISIKVKNTDGSWKDLDSVTTDRHGNYSINCLEPNKTYKIRLYQWANQFTNIRMECNSLQVTGAQPTKAFVGTNTAIDSNFTFHDEFTSGDRMSLAAIIDTPAMGRKFLDVDAGFIFALPSSYPGNSCPSSSSSSTSSSVSVSSSSLTSSSSSSSIVSSSSSSSSSSLSSSQSSSSSSSSSLIASSSSTSSSTSSISGVLGQGQSSSKSSASSISGVLAETGTDTRPVAAFAMLGIGIVLITASMRKRNSRK